MENIKENIVKTLIVLDRDSNIRTVHKATCELLGYREEELIGNPVHVVLPATEETLNERKLDELIKGDELKNYETYLKTKDGKKIPILFDGSVIKDKEGNIDCIVCTARETDRHQLVEEASRGSEEKYRTILEDIEEGYYEVDIAGNFTFFNDSICRIWGYPKEELIGMNNLQYADEEYAKKLHQVFNQVYRTGEPVKGLDLEVIRKDGIKTFTEVSVSLIRDSEGKPIGFRGVARDTSEHKRAGEALKKSEEEAKRLAQENAIMAEIGRIISSTLNIEEVYDPFAEAVKKLIPFDRIVINTINIKKDTISNVYMAGKAVVGRKIGEIYPLKGSGSAEMVRTQSSQLIQTEDFSEYKDRFPMLLSTFQSGFRSILDVPLFSKGRIIGGLLLRSLKPYAYTDKDVKLAEGIAHQIAGAIASAKLFSEHEKAEEALKKNETEAKRLAQENAIMAEIGRIISSTLNIEEVYERFAEEVLHVIPFDRVSVNTINPDRTSITIAYSFGITVGPIQVGDVLPLDAPFEENIFNRRSSVLIQAEDESELAKSYPNLVPHYQAGLRSMMTVPLISKDQVIGILHIQSLKPNAYTELDLRLAERVGNEIAGAIANAQLFAERKQAEEGKAVLQEQLRQSQKMESIGQLAGGVAHDFNNILTVIHGYSELVINSLDPTDPIRDDVKEIKTAAERASALTRQLLAFSRKQMLQPKVIDLNALVTNMVKMLRRMIGEGIQLNTLLANDLASLKADPGQIEQVILNLAVNAKDAMPNGGTLTVETANVELDQDYADLHLNAVPGPYVMLSVSDTGVGMTPEVRQRVLEPFFTTKEKGKGTGLGLSTVYGIVKQSGGNIWIYSEPGQGSTFKIYLPRVEEEADSMLQSSVVANKSQQGSETILLVEDEKMVRSLALTILKRQGYNVLEAENGDKALRIVQEQNANSIHLMLTDVVMPGMSGQELSERLKPQCPGMKVIYMSGYTDEAIVEKYGLSAPGIHYLQKPFPPDTLVKRVRSVLDGLR